MDLYIIKDNTGYVAESVFTSMEEARERINRLLQRESFSDVKWFTIYYIDTRDKSMNRCQNVYRDIEEEIEES